MTLELTEMIAELTAAYSNLVPKWTPTIYPNSVEGIACGFIHAEVSGPHEGWYFARVGRKYHVPHTKGGKTPSEALTTALVGWGASLDVDGVPPEIQSMPRVQELRCKNERARATIDLSYLTRKRDGMRQEMAALNERLSKISDEITLTEDKLKTLTTP